MQGSAFIKDIIKLNANAMQKSLYLKTGIPW